MPSGSRTARVTYRSIGTPATTSTTRPSTSELRAYVHCAPGRARAAAVRASASCRPAAVASRRTTGLLVDRAEDGIDLDVPVMDAGGVREQMAQGHRALRRARRHLAGASRRSAAGRAAARTRGDRSPRDRRRAGFPASARWRIAAATTGFVREATGRMSPGASATPSSMRFWPNASSCTTRPRARTWRTAPGISPLAIASRTSSAAGAAHAGAGRSDASPGRGRRGSDGARSPFPETRAHLTCPSCAPASASAAAASPR